LSFIGFSESLESKYCGKSGLCFWVEYAAVNPIGEGAVYFFDCTLYKYARGDYTGRPDARILLSFRSPVSINSLYYSPQGVYPRLKATSKCDKSDVEECIASVLNAIDVAVEKAREYYEKSPKTPRWLRFLLPVRDARSEARGVYYGFLTRKRLLLEITSLMGYREGYLEALVKPSNILLSYNTKKREIYALIGDNPVKLEAHRKILDFNQLTLDIEN